MFRKKPLVTSLTAILATLGGTGAVAQDQQPASGSSPMLEEVIVTAQRRAENLQEVPMSVTAISSEQVQDYNLFRFEDLEQVSPGLSLVSEGAFGSVVQLRGVGFDSNASSAPAVDVYFNESPLDANFAFQSLYDIGQIEVLRGPQGTLRGRPSPGGAITVTTKKASLDEMGGYLSGSAGDQGTNDIQGAASIPIVDEILAIRLAGVYNEDENGSIKSVNSGEETDRDTTSWRASGTWAMTDSLEAWISYQWLETDLTLLTEVEGTGAGYNGPAIDQRKGLSVMEDKSGGTQKSKITTWGGLWDLDKHSLVYSGAYQDNSYDFNTELDIYNAVTNFLELQNVPTTYEVTSHDLRLESTAPDLFMDYLVGLYYYDNKVRAGFSQPTPLPGAFGNPLAPSPVGPPASDYILTASGSIPVDQTDQAIYANLTFHLTDRTDLSLGARYQESESDRTETINTSEAFIDIDIATPAGFPPGQPLGFCEFVPVDGITGEEPWPGFCQLALAAGQSESEGGSNDNEWVYNGSISHNFTDELMAYFRYDHSFRPAGVTVGLTAPVTDPALVQGDSEESDSFEIGLRSDWLDGRMRVNASAFHQEFDNFIGRFNDVPYVGAGDQIIAGGFTYPGDATVDGFELEVTGQITDSWWGNISMAYSDGKYDDATVPCRDTNGDGQPDDGDIGNLTLEDFAGESVLYCDIDSAISTIPNWVTTVQSEYIFPLLSFEGYMRGLYNFYGDQDNLGGVYEAKAYGVLNLYAGIRDTAGSWEMGLWAKNVFDEDNQLKRGKPQTVYGTFEPNYYEVGYVPELEVGITLSYTFGGG